MAFLFLDLMPLAFVVQGFARNFGTLTIALLVPGFDQRKDTFSSKRIYFQVSTEAYYYQPSYLVSMLGTLRILCNLIFRICDRTIIS